MKKTEAPTKGSRTAKFTAKVAEAVDIVEDELNSLHDEMQEWFDNMPEGLQGGSKGDEVQESADELSQRVEELEELRTAIDNLGDFIKGVTFAYTQDTRRSARSRSARLGNIQGVISGLLTLLEDDKKIDAILGTGSYMKFKDTIDEAVGSARDFCDNCGSVSFPGMY